MPWDKKYYKEIKKWTRSELDRVGPNKNIYGGKQIYYSEIFVGMVPDLIKKEDWEAAQAIKDAIKEWINDNLPVGETKITDANTLKLPEWKERERCAFHLSMCSPDDKFGLGGPGSYGINGSM